MSKPLAYSYIRMSTDIQSKGDSLRRQTEASEAYAAENNLELVRDFKLEDFGTTEFTDIGVSAFKGLNVSQGALGLFLKAVQNQLVPAGSYLLVESLDRLSRERPQTATALFLQILESGVHIVTLTDKRVYRSGSNDFSDIIVSVVIMSRAFEESQTKSQRVSAAWSNKRKSASEKKLTKIAPAWLRLSDDRATFELIDDRVAVVREIFEEAAKGRGSYQISRRFNLAGRPSFNRAEKGWQESYITKLLNSRAVLGEYQPHHYVEGKRVPHGDPVLGYYPAIIDNQLFDRIQLGRKNRLLRGAGRKGNAYTNLFQGVAKCGYCGSKMMIVDKGPKPKGGVYLRCDSARRGYECTAGMWPLAHFERAFLFFVEELDLNALQNERQTASLVRELEDKQLALEGQIEQLSAKRDLAFDLLGTATVSTEFVQAQLEKLSEQIAAATAQLADNKLSFAEARYSVPIDKSDVVELISSINSSAPDRRANLRTQVANWIKNFIETIKIYPEGTEGPPANILQRPDPQDDVATFVFERATRFARRHGALRSATERTFEVLFKGGLYRKVEVDRQDATRHLISMSIDAQDGRWSVRQVGKDSRNSEMVFVPAAND